MQLLAIYCGISPSMTKKRKLLLLLTAISGIWENFMETYCAQLSFLPKLNAPSTQEPISSLVHLFGAIQNLFWTGDSPWGWKWHLQGWSIAVNCWTQKKRHNCGHWSRWVLPALHPLWNYMAMWLEANRHNAVSCCLNPACQTVNKHRWLFNDRQL